MTQPPESTSRPLRGTHDLGEIVGYSYRIYLRDFAVLFGLALLTVPLQLMSGVIAQSYESEGADAIVNLLQLPQVFVSLVAAAAIIDATHVVSGGAKPSFSGSLDAAFERLGDIVVTFLLVLVLAMAAALAAPALAVYWLFNRRATIDGERNWWLAVVPGLLLLYLAVRWAFNSQAVMIGGKRNWAALDDSAAAVRSYWWRTLGIIIVVTLIILGPSMLASYATALPPLAAASIIAGVSALVLPFAVVAQTLLYYDLKTRNYVPAPPTIDDTLTADGSLEERQL